MVESNPLIGGNLDEGSGDNNTAIDESFEEIILVIDDEEETDGGDDNDDQEETIVEIVIEGNDQLAPPPSPVPPQPSTCEFDRYNQQLKQTPPRTPKKKATIERKGLAPPSPLPPRTPKSELEQLFESLQKTPGTPKKQTIANIESNDFVLLSPLPPRPPKKSEDSPKTPKTPRKKANNSSENNDLAMSSPLPPRPPKNSKDSPRRPRTPRTPKRKKSKSTGSKVVAPPSPWTPETPKKKAIKSKKEKASPKKQKASPISYPKENNNLLIGGFKFTKIDDRKNGILVTSVDPEDTMEPIVVSAAAENSDANGNKTADKQNGEEDRYLKTIAVIFCRIVNKILRKERSACFTGKEVILKMVTNGLAKTRAEALVLGTELSMKLRLFHHIEFEVDFSDDEKLYRFRPEVLLSIIMGTPMSIQKPMPSDKISLESESPGSKKGISTKKEKKDKKNKTKKKKEKKIKKKKKDRTSTKGTESVEHMPQSILAKNGNQGIMEPILETLESSEADDEQIIAEATDSKHKNVALCPWVPTKPQHMEEDPGYDELASSLHKPDRYVPTRSLLERVESERSVYTEVTLQDNDDNSLFPSVPSSKTKRLERCESERSIYTEVTILENDDTSLFPPAPPKPKRLERCESERSVYTEVTILSQDDTSLFPPAFSNSQQEDLDSSFMEFTVASEEGERKNNTSNFYFEEDALSDADVDDCDEFYDDADDEYIENLTVPSTPVVFPNPDDQLKTNDPSGERFSPTDVISFDMGVTAECSGESSPNDRMKRGEFNIEIPCLDGVSQRPNKSSKSNSQTDERLRTDDFASFDEKCISHKSSEEETSLNRIEFPSPGDDSLPDFLDVSAYHATAVSPIETLLEEARGHLEDLHNYTSQANEVKKALAVERTKMTRGGSRMNLCKQ